MWYWKHVWWGFLNILHFPETFLQQEDFGETEEFPKLIIQKTFKTNHQNECWWCVFPSKPRICRNFMFLYAETWNCLCCAYDLVRFMHRNHLIVVGKAYVLAPSTQIHMEIVLTSHWLHCFSWNCPDVLSEFSGFLFRKCSDVWSKQLGFVTTNMACNVPMTHQIDPGLLPLIWLGNFQTTH